MTRAIVSARVYSVSPRLAARATRTRLTRPTTIPPTKITPATIQSATPRCRLTTGCEVAAKIHITIWFLPKYRGRPNAAPCFTEGIARTGDTRPVRGGRPAGQPLVERRLPSDHR